MSHKYFAYRSDIDGLRAIAVVSVVIYHLFPTLLSGGFIGVDLFFVISGFLITGILLKENEARKFSILKFYSRRILRIFPALLLVLVVTLIIGWWVLLAHEYKTLGWHIFGASTFISNLILVSESGYFNGASELKPLLHLWSLGVEEQFYLIWPVLVYFALKKPSYLLLITLFGVVSSFIINLMFVGNYPELTFFLPVTRFWELFIGGLLAQRQFTQSLAKSSTFYNYISVIGLFGIIASLFLINKTMEFPGWVALFPVIGAYLLICSGQHSLANKYLLSNNVLVYIGKISYPLYLWHWPLIVYSNIVFIDGISNSLNLAILLISFVLAHMTFKYIEKPINHFSKINNNQKKVITLLFTSIILLGACGLLVKSEVLVSRLDAVSNDISKAANDWEVIKSQRYTFGDESSDQIVFLGDSYTKQLSPRFDELSREKGFNDNSYSITMMAEQGCAPISHIYRLTNKNCLSFTKNAYSYLSLEKVKKVVVFGSWYGLTKRKDYYFESSEGERKIDFNSDDIYEVFDILYEDLLKLKKLDKELYIVLVPPTSKIANPSYYDGRLDINPQLEVKKILLSQHLSQVEGINKILINLANKLNINIVNPTEWFCDNSNCYFSDKKGIPLFKDSTHIKSSYVRCCITAFDHLIKK